RLGAGDRRGRQAVRGGHAGGLAPRLAAAARGRRAEASRRTRAGQRRGPVPDAATRAGRALPVHRPRRGRRPHDRDRLAGRDGPGKPVAGAQVVLLAADAPTETTTDGRGAFRLEVGKGKAFGVVVRHPAFRVGGAYYESNPSDPQVTLVRLDEPADKRPRRP